jgi:hypothetical protein
MAVSITVTNNMGRSYYMCCMCGAPVGKCAHTAGVKMHNQPLGRVTFQDISDVIDYKAIEKRISYIYQIREYLDDKFLEYFVAKPHTYDNGCPNEKHMRKQQGRGAMFVIARLSSKMAREVVVPGMKDIAARHRKKVTVRGYLPKGRCMLRAFKVQVS